jgi:hypothetical protein
MRKRWRKMILVVVVGAIIGQAAKREYYTIIIKSRYPLTRPITTR